jgi:hypothetical protein
MVTREEVINLLNTSTSDFTDQQVDDAISLAEERFLKVTELASLPEIPSAQQKKAVILMAVQELATGVNLYWRGPDKTESIRVKDLALEIERLLDLSPTGPILVSPDISQEDPNA